MLRKEALSLVSADEACSTLHDVPGSLQFQQLGALDIHNLAPEAPALGLLKEQSVGQPLLARG